MKLYSITKQLLGNEYNLNYHYFSYENIYSCGICNIHINIENFIYINDINICNKINNLILMGILKYEFFNKPFQ